MERSENEVLAVFSDPHSYISSSWYDHENVPTWNSYCSSNTWENHSITKQHRILKKLVDKYEKGSENPIRIGRRISKKQCASKGNCSL
jgi:transcriptional regulator